MPIKGAAIPSDPFSVRFWPADRRTPRHIRYQPGSRLELWGERSGDITPRGSFKCSINKSYQ